MTRNDLANKVKASCPNVGQAEVMLVVRRTIDELEAMPAGSVAHLLLERRQKDLAAEVARLRAAVEPGPPQTPPEVQTKKAKK